MGMTAIIDPAIGRRAFCLSLGAGLTILSLPSIAGAADLKKVPMSTGIDAVFAPFVVASEKKIFEKYGLETNYKPFDDGNVALDAVLTGASDIGSTRLPRFGGRFFG
jgi:ABC-type nitrate/sulfonate/bicarbonate transport system substrate-binding protein